MNLDRYIPNQDQKKKKILKKRHENIEITPILSKQQALIPSKEPDYSNVLVFCSIDQQLVSLKEECKVCFKYTQKLCLIHQGKHEDEINDLFIPDFNFVV